MTIKGNRLNEVFGETNISGLVQYTADEYRTNDPGKYLYRQVMKFEQHDKFSDEFIELAYVTLVA